MSKISGSVRLAESTFRRIEKLREQADKLETQLRSQVNELTKEEFADYVKVTSN